LDRNIVNVCINYNDNFLGAEFVGTREQIEPPPPTPSMNFLDLAVTNQGTNTVSILLGNGDGTFGTGTTFQVDNSPSSVAVGDFN